MVPRYRQCGCELAAADVVEEARLLIYQEAEGTFLGNGAWLTGRCRDAVGAWHDAKPLQAEGLPRLGRRDEVLDATEAVTLIDRGFRGLAKARAHWHAPIGDRRTKDQRTDAERAYNRDQAGLRALVEQSIGHLANAWSLRRWRGLLYRVRDVFRTAAVLVSLSRWLHRIPT